jgi:hypothetical protein
MARADPSQVVAELHLDLVWHLRTLGTRWVITGASLKFLASPHNRLPVLVVHESGAIGATDSLDFWTLKKQQRPQD